MKKKTILSILFIFSIATRLALFVAFTGHEDRHLIYFDSAQYQAVAENIVMGKGISNKEEKPQAYRLPGYPLFLASIYSLFGINQQIAMVIQLTLSSLIPLLIHSLSLTLFPSSPFTALICGLISAFHIGFIVYSGILGTESLFLIMLLLFFISYFQLLKDQNPSLRQLLLSGFFLGCVSLIRPVGHYLLIFSLLIFLFGARTQLFKRICSISIVALSWLATAAPWLIRNYIIFGAPFFHSLPGLHFLQYSGAKIIMHTDQCNYVEARGMLLDQWKREQSNFEQQHLTVPNEYESCLMAEKITFNLIKQNPIIFLKNSILEMLKTVLSLYSAQLIFADTQSWTEYKPTSQALITKIKYYLWPPLSTWWLHIIIFFELCMNIFLLIGVSGFYINAFFFKKHFFSLLTTTLFMLLFIGITCAYGCARLRMPLEPFTILIALQFWTSLCINFKWFIE